jgi:FERM N-terminal domain
MIHVVRNKIRFLLVVAQALAMFFVFFQPKLLATELYDLVASHFNLKEKEYFGLMFKDET